MQVPAVSEELLQGELVDQPIDVESIPEASGQPYSLPESPEHPLSGAAVCKHGR